MNCWYVKKKTPTGIEHRLDMRVKHSVLMSKVLEICLSLNKYSMTRENNLIIIKEVDKIENTDSSPDM